jgi:hypothetical protein
MRLLAVQVAQNGNLAWAHASGLRFSLVVRQRTYRLKLRILITVSWLCGIPSDG